MTNEGTKPSEAPTGTASPETTGTAGTTGGATSPATGYYETDADPDVAAKQGRIESLEEVSRYLAAMDLSGIRTRLGKDLGWSEDKLLYVEGQYRNWLFLQRKYEGHVMPPSTDMDEYWHAHILDTRAYHRDTDRVFGYYLHHFPYFGIRDEQDRQDLLDSWEHTQELYLAEFGEEVYEFDEDEDEEEGGPEEGSDRPDIGEEVGVASEAAPAQG